MLKFNLAGIRNWIKQQKGKKTPLQLQLNYFYPKTPILTGLKFLDFI